MAQNRPTPRSDYFPKRGCDDGIGKQETGGTTNPAIDGDPDFGGGGGCQGRAPGEEEKPDAGG